MKDLKHVLTLYICALLYSYVLSLMYSQNRFVL